MLPDFLGPAGGPLGQVDPDKPPANEVAEQVAEGGPRGRAETDEQEGHREREEVPGDNGKEDRTGDGECLKK